ncbi:MAG: hypothetical protein KAU20_01730 [Nanoarchaeota archaeon]|nr:hypothetical protein [Nanoarchaeota archaeon]
MLWTWDGSSFYGTGSFAPSISGVLPQNGNIKRTITGRGELILAWTKTELTFSWVDAPEEIKTKLKAMSAYNDTITFTDSIVGSYYFMLTDDALRIGEAVDGLISASAVFRER